MEPYRRYRAPIENGTALVDPPWEYQLAQLSAAKSAPPTSFGDTSLEDLSMSARQQLVADAVSYTRQYADVDLPPREGPLVVSGHQPELFHPGVWFKNFALDALAKRSGGVGIHLLIDSDLCRTPSIRIPTGTLQHPRAEVIAYDATETAMPHEQRAVRDRACFQSFAERTTATISPLVSNPLVSELWPRVVDASTGTRTLAGSLSIGRHRIERQWGSTTLELPASTVADAAPFRQFAAELIAQAADVAATYNTALAEYRVAHRLKNAAQPLPDLEVDSNHIIETPLWVWSDSDPIRRPLFVVRNGNSITLTNRLDWEAEGPGDSEGLVSWLFDLHRGGVKIRSRALITTLYARLILSDLFLHGIGGAKYDQVTDRFAERLLGIVPPPHAILTATLRLPIDHELPDDDDRRALVQRKRDLRHHPERFVSESPATDAALVAKQRWIDTPKTPENAAERHAAIAEANQALSATLETDQQLVETRLEQVDRGLRDAALLNSREHSLVLFPGEMLRERLTALAGRPDRPTP